MVAPKNYESMSDEALLKELVKIYETEEAAAFALKVLRGTISFASV